MNKHSKQLCTKGVEKLMSGDDYNNIFIHSLGVQLNPSLGNGRSMVQV